MTLDTYMAPNNFNTLVNIKIIIIINKIFNKI